jgi:tetratricopeptide (TPR) repeat protein
MKNAAFKGQSKTMSKSKLTAFAIVTAAVAAVIYLPTLTADFVYDDVPQIIIDNYIHTSANFTEVISLSVLKKDIIDNNRPVMLLSLMFDSLLWGRNPFGYHLTNLLLHSLCSAMVFLLLYGVLNRLFPESKKNISALWAAFVAAIFFAIHPVNSEAVCVVTFREDMLAAFFTLLALVLAERFPTERKAINILLSGLIVISIFAAAAAKESGIVAPFFLLVYWLIVRRGCQWRIWIKLIAAGFGATAAFMIVRFTLVPAQSAIFSLKAPYINGSFSKMLAVQPRIWTFQLLELVWPKLLCADQIGYSIRFITLSAALVALAGVIAAVVLLCRKNIGFAAGAIFYFLAILPTSNLVPIYRPMADRYLYLPMVGVCMALGAVICRLKMPVNRLYKRLWIVVIAAVCIFFSFFTVQRIFVWHDSNSLWQDTVKKNPFSYTGYDNLGFALFDAGEFEKAIPVFTRASQLEPNNPDSIAGLAITYNALGMSAPADEAFRKAVSLDKHYTNYYSLMQTLTWTPRQAEKLQIIADRVLAKQKAVLE